MQIRSSNGQHEKNIERIAFLNLNICFYVFGEVSPGISCVCFGEAPDEQVLGVIIPVNIIKGFCQPVRFTLPAGASDIPVMTSVP